MGTSGDRDVRNVGTESAAGGSIPRWFYARRRLAAVRSIALPVHCERGIRSRGSGRLPDTMRPTRGGGEQKGGASLSAQLGQVLFGFLNTGIRSFPVPPFRFGEIFRDAIAVFITPAHLELCNGIPLFSSLSVPLYGFCVVLFDAFAPVIAGAQIVLCTGIPLFSGLSVPLYGFCVVFCNAFAIVITIPETVLCDTVSRFGRFAPQFYGFGIIAGIVGRLSASAASRRSRTGRSSTVSRSSISLSSTVCTHCNRSSGQSRQTASSL